MKQNILQESGVTKIFLIYTNPTGAKKKVPCKLRYMGARECFFSTEITVNFIKPAKRSLAELTVYTDDGVYKTNVQILDTTVSINDLLYQVSMPTTWKFVQLRMGSRKQMALPMSITFNDGYTIETETYDVAVGGASYCSMTPLASIYQRVPCEITIQFPHGMAMSFPDDKLIAGAKFIRVKENFEDAGGESLYVFKFINLSPTDSMILKNFLIVADY